MGSIHSSGKFIHCIYGWKPKYYPSISRCKHYVLKWLIRCGFTQTRIDILRQPIYKWHVSMSLFTREIVHLFYQFREHIIEWMNELMNHYCVVKDLITLMVLMKHFYKICFINLFNIFNKSSLLLVIDYEHIVVRALSHDIHVSKGLI